jgi:hypothetical protein
MGTAYAASSGAGDSTKEPNVPAVRPVVVVELAIALQVEVSLHACHGKNIADLRTDTDDARFEGAQHWSTAAVAGELLVEISDKADLQSLGQKL